MKLRTKVFVAPFALLLATTIFQPLSAPGQGTLTPPGAPGPTMLTLSQMEPRRPISAPLDIAQSGSYYLTTNIVVAPASSGITIDANNVTLDLNGFTISSSSSPAAGYGIYIGVLALVTNITIMNGFISSSGITNNSSGGFGGSGFRYGIYGGGYNLFVKNVSVNGSLYDGINLTVISSIAQNCNVVSAGGGGIIAQSVLDSTAINCGNYGINSGTANNCYGQSYFDGIDANNANNCYGQSFASGYGMNVAYAAINCFGTSSSSYGVSARNAENCYGSSGISDGVVGGMINNCFGVSTSGTGIFADNANNCYGYTSGGGYGVFADFIATGCYGYSLNGIGLDAIIASVCHGATSTGTALSVTHNINSF